MTILYSAYECNPNLGSDAYVGWSWVLSMSKYENVHVLTHERNREDIENFKKKNNINAVFHYIDTKSIINRIIGKRIGYFYDYVIWQKYAYRYVKNLIKKTKIDVIHHVSIADFRVIGDLWKLNIPFIYGPVGGGQVTPRSMEKYIKKFKFKEKLREIINIIAVIRPKYRKAIKKAYKVYISNNETISFIKKYSNKDVELIRMCELGIDEKSLNKNENIVHELNDVVHILVAGRLMYRKGIEFLLDVVERIETKKKFIVDIYGRGQQKESIEKKIHDKKLEEIVKLHNGIPYTKMEEIYMKSDVLILPSLRETTGTVVIEAMSNKLPVVALNQNGVKYLIENDSGYLVDISYDCDEIISDFTKGMTELIEDYTLRRKLGENGFNKLKTYYTWQKKAELMLKVYQESIDYYRKENK